jgi:hypothetical protein
LEKIKEKIKMKTYEKYLINEATFTVSYPSKTGRGPGKTKDFPTMKKAREEAKKASMEMDGYVIVMRNGIDEYEYIRGKEKKTY